MARSIVAARVRSLRPTRLVTAPRAWPAPPAARRPVRPARCRYATVLRGKSKLTTCVTLGMSRPRAAMSVQTRIGASPSAKARRFSRRCGEGMSAWYSASARPASRSACEAARAEAAELQKTIVRPRALTTSSSFASLSAPRRSMKSWRTVGAERCRSDAAISAMSGSVVSRSCSRRLGVMVAVAQMTCRSAAGRGGSSFARSSQKPCVSIVSTSSMTTCVTPPRYTLPASRCLSSRPGLATTTSRVRSSSFFCLPCGSPPMTVPLLTLAWCESILSVPDTCIASSRVGTSTSARGRFGRRSAAAPSSPAANSSARSRSTSGSRYASVLPLPVPAASTADSPARSRGSASFWMGLGCWMFCSESAVSSRSDSPSAANCDGDDGCGAEDMRAACRTARPAARPSSRTRASVRIVRTKAAAGAPGSAAGVARQRPARSTGERGGERGSRQRRPRSPSAVVCLSARCLFSW